MALYHRFTPYPLACLLAALCSVSCMQIPQAEARTDPMQGVLARTASVHCHSGAADASWRALEQELRGQGLAVRQPCTGAHLDGALQLVVLDSVRASTVLRGPLADGEPVELGTGADASPDMQFNRAWLDHALLRHQVLGPS